MIEQFDKEVQFDGKNYLFYENVDFDFSGQRKMKFEFRENQKMIYLTISMKLKAENSIGKPMKLKTGLWEDRQKKECQDGLRFHS